MTNGEATFKRISNNDIYKEIKKLEIDFREFKVENIHEHEKFFKSHEENKSKVYWALALGTMALSTAVYLAIIHIK